MGERLTGSTLAQQVGARPVCDGLFAGQCGQLREFGVGEANAQDVAASLVGGQLGSADAGCHELTISATKSLRLGLALASTDFGGHNKYMTTTQTAAAKLTIVKVEDHEYEGRCTHCGRENIRWITTLSDGRAVGVGCLKELLGVKLAPANYTWTADYTPVAQHVEYGETFVLWQHKTGNATRQTVDGQLTVIGGVRQAWARDGWLAA